MHHDRFASHDIGRKRIGSCPPPHETEKHKTRTKRDKENAANSYRIHTCLRFYGFFSSTASPSSMASSVIRFSVATIQSIL